jgi:thiamine transport system substrate-binding protein
VLKKLLPCLLMMSAPVLAAKPVLTVYTYDSFSSEWGPGPAIKKAFEANCDCEVKYVALEDGVTLLNRLRMEGKNSPADVVVGLDNNLVQSAQQTGLFAKSHINATLDIPGGWHDDTFVPFDYGYFAFVYDKNKIKNPPTSFEQLVNSNQPWKIIYEDPRTSTPGLGLLLWVEKIYGAQSGAVWQKLAKKTVTVTKGWTEAYGLFLKGESDFVLSYTTSPAYHIIEEKKTNYAAANFSEGHYIQVEVAAQLSASQHPQLAAQFMQFVVSPQFQNTLPTGNWMYPVVKTPLPAGFEQMVVPAKPLQYSAKEVAEHHNQWMQTWQNAVSH